MGVRIKNDEDLNFGDLGAETAITHGRVSVGSAVMVVEALDEAITVGANASAEMRVGTISFFFPSNTFEDAGYKAFLELALNGKNSLQIDLMTSDSAVVAATGYAQQSTAKWSVAEEADPED